MLILKRSCKSCLILCGPDADGAVVAAGDYFVDQESERVNTGTLADGSRAGALEIPDANSAVQ